MVGALCKEGEVVASSDGDRGAGRRPSVRTKSEEGEQVGPKFLTPSGERIDVEQSFSSVS